MTNRLPQRVAVIGFDCAMPHLIEKHIAEGYLPNFKKLIEAGVMADNCLPVFPTITPPNWASIATGAWPGTHGITDFWAPTEGVTPDNRGAVEAFSSERWQAESIWEALDKAGKSCIVINYPGAWPSRMKNGIMVGGSGLTIGEFRDGLPATESKHLLCNAQLISTGIYPRAVKGQFAPANDWRGLEDDSHEPLEMKLELDLPETMEKTEQVTWYILARNSTGNGYDSITLAPDKDLAGAFFTIKPGHWSKKCFITIRMADGTFREAFFRCKLLELSEDAQDFRLYISALCQTNGWAEPPSICNEIESDDGLFGHEGGLIGLSEGWYDLDTYVEINELHDAWLGDVVTTLLKKHKWDLLYLHSHPIDWGYHVLMDNLDEDNAESREDFEKAWATHRRIYETQDRMLGRIVEAAGEGTLFVLVSDHGAGTGGPTFNPYHPLVAAGLTVMQVKEGKPTGRSIPDISKSKVLAQRMCYLYINLKGRDPEGIVDPADYTKVQKQVINALYTWIDPVTGQRPVSLALTKQDARILGLHGDRIGDIVYALYTDAGNQHGQQLSSSESTVGKLKTLLVLSGPGVKQGYRMSRTCWLTDIVPTLCYLNHWPVPANTEGSVLYQALTNPHNLGQNTFTRSVEGNNLEDKGKYSKNKSEDISNLPFEKPEDHESASNAQKKKMNDRLKKLGYDLPF